MKIIKLKEQLFQVSLTDVEVDILEDRVPQMDDLGIEIYEGENILEKDTLWLFLCELNATNYHTHDSLALTETLKILLYPQL